MLPDRNEAPDIMALYNRWCREIFFRRMFGSSEYLPTFAVSKAIRIFSSVGLEHYLDRVGVGGSSPPRFTKYCLMV